MLINNILLKLRWCKVVLVKQNFEEVYKRKDVWDGLGKLPIYAYIYIYISVYISAYIHLERKCKDQLKEENEMEKCSERPWGETVRDGARGWLDA